MKLIKYLAIGAASIALGLASAVPALAAPDEIVFVPFDEATVIDPNTVTFVTGGLIDATGNNLCAVNPGSIVFPDGTYPCFIDFASPTPDPAPQVGQLPVGGVDTGVSTPPLLPPETATIAAVSAGTVSLVAALVVLPRRAE
ncbi:hypothetical protein [Arthrobacter sp. 260]|uniref:hypothetical protein n=1 Tax=Arthrobacter sp. 260 TaxID=2735314 RepID=UPI001490F1E2|nr:hypothetical protein [Arthrobacter sp. 260]NOJ60185.1 hypothetical protein [Arthrobacter sp. 260]